MLLVTPLAPAPVSLHLDPCRAHVQFLCGRCGNDYAHSRPHPETGPFTSLSEIPRGSGPDRPSRAYRRCSGPSQVQRRAKESQFPNTAGLDSALGSAGVCTGLMQRGRSTLPRSNVDRVLASSRELIFGYCPSLHPVRFVGVELPPPPPPSLDGHDLVVN